MKATLRRTPPRARRPVCRVCRALVVRAPPTLACGVVGRDPIIHGARPALAVRHGSIGPSILVRRRVDINDWMGRSRPVGSQQDVELGDERRDSGRDRGRGRALLACR